jgi:hypothetical protein
MSSTAAASSASLAALALLFSHQKSSAGLPSKHHLSICLSPSLLAKQKMFDWMLSCSSEQKFRQKNGFLFFSFSTHSTWDREQRACLAGFL